MSWHLTPAGKTDKNIEKLAKLFECEHCLYKVHTSWQPPTPQHFLLKKGDFHRLPAKKIEVPGTNSKESFSPSTRNRLGRLKNRKNCVKFTFITRCAATVASVECKGLLWIFQYHGWYWQGCLKCLANDQKKICSTKTVLGNCLQNDSTQHKRPPKRKKKQKTKRQNPFQNSHNNGRGAWKCKKMQKWLQLSQLLEPQFSIQKTSADMQGCPCLESFVGVKNGIVIWNFHISYIRTTIIMSMTKWQQLAEDKAELEEQNEGVCTAFGRRVSNQLQNGWISQQKSQNHPKSQPKSFTTEWVKSTDSTGLTAISGQTLITTTNINTSDTIPITSITTPIVITRGKTRASRCYSLNVVGASGDKLSQNLKLIGWLADGQPNKSLLVKPWNKQKKWRRV